MNKTNDITPSTMSDSFGTLVRTGKNEQVNGVSCQWEITLGDPCRILNSLCSESKDLTESKDSLCLESKYTSYLY